MKEETQEDKESEMRKSSKATWRYGREFFSGDTTVLGSSAVSLGTSHVHTITRPFSSSFPGSTEKLLSEFRFYSTSTLNSARVCWFTASPDVKTQHNLPSLFWRPRTSPLSKGHFRLTRDYPRSHKGGHFHPVSTSSLLFALLDQDPPEPSSHSFKPRSISILPQIC